jgi:hypothetical protein
LTTEKISSGHFLISRGTSIVSDLILEHPPAEPERVIKSGEPAVKKALRKGLE